MIYSSIPSAQSVVSHCEAKGIQNIVISPGSRNAPLTIGFTENPFFTCFSIVDERCAAFFALGISQQLQKPVALVCTSGSALLNYYPAVAEAFYSDYPLVVISADRPQHKIDIGDGQTIRQANIFEKHIGYSANLKEDSREVSDGQEQQHIQKYNDGELNKALNIAIDLKSPVHINVPLEEPLYETLTDPVMIPNIVFEQNDKEDSTESLVKYAKIWNSAKKKMVLVGVSGPNAVEQNFLEQLATDPSVLVFTETTSNLHHSNFFPSIDSIIAPIEISQDREVQFEKLRPELLITFGGLIVSKKIKAFLRDFRPVHHWHIDPKKAYDTYFSLSHHFKEHVNTFFKRFLSHTHKVDSTYRPYWDAVRQSYRKKREIYLGKIPFSDMYAFDKIMESIPKNYQLQLANSSTVRYSQLFDLDPSIKVFCNRGTSGIDGSTSTAVGSSIYSDSPTLLLTGDLSFLYDSNALWNNYLRADFRIIVLNNGGGGIFRILPGKKDTKQFENYFETIQDLDLQKLCMLYEIDYTSVSDAKSINNCLLDFYDKSGRPKLLDVRTPRLENDKILLTYFDFLS